MLARLTWLAVAVALGGAPWDMLKDILRGKKPDITTSVIDSWINYLVFNRYQLNLVKRKGFTEGLWMVLKPAIPFEPVRKDVKNWQFRESPRVLPYGDEWYWLYGYGAEKTAKEEKESGRGLGL